MLGRSLLAAAVRASAPSSPRPARRSGATSASSPSSSRRARSAPNTIFPDLPEQELLAAPSMRRRSSREGWCACRTPRSTRSPRAAARRLTPLGGSRSAELSEAVRRALEERRGGSTCSSGGAATSSTSRRCSGARCSCPQRATSPRRGAPRPRRDTSSRTRATSSYPRRGDPGRGGDAFRRRRRSSVRASLRTTTSRAPRRAARAADGGPARPSRLESRQWRFELAPVDGGVAAQAVELLAPRGAREGALVQRWRCRHDGPVIPRAPRAGPRDPRQNAVMHIAGRAA